MSEPYFIYNGPRKPPLIRCRRCGEPMDAILSEDVRDTCAPCGGEAKGDSIAALNRRRSERLIAMREARTAAPAWSPLEETAR